jgi:hypothetical protein
MSDYDYDTACHLKEQRDFQRYYNTPFEAHGMWFASLAEYAEYYRVKVEHEERLQKLTNDLKTFIKHMLLDADIERMRDSLDEFPPLK